MASLSEDIKALQAAAEVERLRAKIARLKIKYKVALREHQRHLKREQNRLHWARKQGNLV